jgi:hypothetical protein
VNTGLQFNKFIKHIRHQRTPSHYPPKVNAYLRRAERLNRFGYSSGK